MTGQPHPSPNTGSVTFRLGSSFTFDIASLAESSLGSGKVALCCHNVGVGAFDAEAIVPGVGFRPSHVSKHNDAHPNEKPKNKPVPTFLLIPQTHPPCSFAMSQLHKSNTAPASCKFETVACFFSATGPVLY